MTYHITTSGHPTTAIGKHGQMEFKLVASYDGRADAHLVHIYVHERPFEQGVTHVGLLDGFASQDEALSAGEAAAVAHIDIL